MSELQVPNGVYRTPRITRIMMLGVSVLLPVFGLGVLFSSAGPRPGDADWWFAIIWLLGAAWIAYHFWNIAVEIRVDSRDTVEFHKPLGRKIAVSPRAIRSVRGRKLPGAQTATVVYDAGKLDLLLPVDGLYEFLGWLKSSNPSVEINWL